MSTKRIMMARVVATTAVLLALAGIVYTVLCT